MGIYTIWISKWFSNKEASVQVITQKNIIINAEKNENLQWTQRHICKYTLAELLMSHFFYV